MPYRMIQQARRCTAVASLSTDGLQDMSSLVMSRTSPDQADLTKQMLLQCSTFSWQLDFQNASVLMKQLPKLSRIWCSIELYRVVGQGEYNDVIKDQKATGCFSILLQLQPRNATAHTAGKNMVFIAASVPGGSCLKWVS